MGRPKGSKNKPKTLNFTADSTELVPVEKKKKKVSKKKFKKSVNEADKLVAIFGKDSRKIQKLLNSKDDDNAIISAQRALFKMLIDLIPVAEQTYRQYKTERAAYAVNALVSQVRELAQDIIASQDRALAADHIVYNVLKPSFVNFAQFLIDNNFQTTREISSLVKPEDTRELNKITEKSMRSIAAYLQSFSEDLSERIKKSLSE